MMQNLQSARSGEVTSSGTTATQFADVPARLVMIRAKATNTGTVTIIGVNGSSLDSAGIVLAAGEWMPSVWLTNLNALGYITSVSGDKIDYIVYR